LNASDKMIIRGCCPEIKAWYFTGRNARANAAAIDLQPVINSAEIMLCEPLRCCRWHGRGERANVCHSNEKQNPISHEKQSNQRAGFD
jgi:hypothetical protein